MTLQQVKDELEYFFIDQQMKHPNCVHNSVMLLWHWNFKSSLVYLCGHCVVACPVRKLLIDPTCGCIWHCNKLNKEFIQQLLKGKKPDGYLSWYLEDRYRYWWDYTFKYEKNKHKFKTQEEWDIPMDIQITSFEHRKLLQINLGKFSDYMQ